MNECASVDQAYMDGAYLHEELFKKEKWYDCYTQMIKYEKIILKWSNMKDYNNPWYLWLFENMKTFWHALFYCASIVFLFAET